MTNFLKRWRGARNEPVTVMFTDVHSPSLKTDLGAVLKLLRYYRLKNGLPETFNLHKRLPSMLGIDSYDANWQNYESLYLDKAERAKRPAQGYISANLIAAKHPEEFSHLVFDSKVVGKQTDRVDIVSIAIMGL